MIASAARKILSEAGTRLPSSEMTPRAKAMSVAVGIAQPRMVSGFWIVESGVDEGRDQHAARRPRCRAGPAAARSRAARRSSRV